MWITMSLLPPLAVLLAAPAALEPKGLAAGLPLAVAASAALEPKGLAAGRVSLLLAVAAPAALSAGRHSLLRHHTYVCA